jgi:hypothetical protein
MSSHAPGTVPSRGPARRVLEIAGVLAIFDDRASAHAAAG